MNRIRIPRINIDVHGPCLYGRLRGALYLDATGEFVDIWWTKTTCYLTTSDASWLHDCCLISGRQYDSMLDAGSHYHDGQLKRILGHVYPEEFNKRMLVNHDLRGCDFNDLKNVTIRGSTIWDEQLEDLASSVDTTDVKIIPCPWRKYNP